jgi:prepilin-type N-terminal cleavage/methylation domain-containing protein
MDTRASIRRPSPHAESGFTLIEVIVAMVVLVIGILAMVGAFNSARTLDLLSERRTAMAHRAQLEIERLHAKSYSELAMSSTPTHSSESSNPDYYVKEGSTPEYQFGAASTEVEKLVVSESKGAISRTPTSRECSTTVGACEWVDGAVSGSVYDFVTWYSEPSKLCKEESLCPKRITVVVTAKVPTSNHQPASVRTSTVIAEPSP